MRRQEISWEDTDYLHSSRWFFLKVCGMHLCHTWWTLDDRKCTGSPGNLFLCFIVLWLFFSHLLNVSAESTLLHKSFAPFYIHWEHLQPHGCTHCKQPVYKFIFCSWLPAIFEYNSSSLLLALPHLPFPPIVRLLDKIVYLMIYFCMTDN